MPTPDAPVVRRFYNAPVAQPDRVVASEAIGRGFESLRARHLSLFRPHRRRAGRGAAATRHARNDQYVPSNAKIGLRCFHNPAVKSGNSSVWKLLAMDCSDNGVIALQVIAS